MKRNNLWIAGAVAAMFAASCHGAFAQSATDSTGTGTAATSTTTTTTTTSTAPDAGGAAGSSSTLSSNSTTTTVNTAPDLSAIPVIAPYASSNIDYSVLNNPLFDYIDIQQAKARGLSDSEVATVAKISEESRVPFTQVAADVERGETFAQLAQQYNLNLGDVMDVTDEQQKLANYQVAYTTTGEDALKNGNGPLLAHMSTTDTSMYSNSAMASKDIIDTLSSSRRFSTLVQELQIAGLTDTLRGAGPYTLFAPTNRAFSNLPAGTLSSLNSDPTRLRSVLGYHVLPARVTAATAMSMSSPTSPPTVEGDTLQVTSNNGKVMINGANVTKADILASNGVIHAIDQVLMPPAGAAALSSTMGGNTTAPAASTTTTTTTVVTPAPSTSGTTAPATGTSSTTTTTTAPATTTNP